LFQGILEREYFGNTVLSYLICIGVIFISVIVIRIFKAFFLKRLKKWAENTHTSVDDFLILSIEKFLLPLLYFLAVFFGLNFLKFDAPARRILDAIIVIIITFFAIRFIAAIIKYFINLYWKRKSESEEADASIKGISTFVSLIVWGLGLVFLLDNLGFKVSAVIAGLGIGGIAVALAAQAVLGDLFSYFVIFFDRPFQIGDFITVDTKSGVVEKIGIKTTRISSISGEQIVFSNSDLTSSRLHNFKRMLKRRVLFKIGVVYDTSFDQLKEIPQLLKNIIEENEEVTFDRAHFQSYGDFSLNFEVVYYVIGSDYIKFMDIQQNINLRIFEEFAKRKIEFAYPTQTLFLNGKAETAS